MQMVEKFPLHLWEKQTSNENASNCVFLVTDRVMKEASDSYYNYRERYDPSVGAPDPFDCEVQQPADLQIMQNAPVGERRTVIGINNAPRTGQAAVTRVTDLKN
jgi:hypothetical protein